MPNKEKHTQTETIPFSFPLDILKQAEEGGEFHIVGYAATSDFDMQGDIITDEALKGSSLDLLKNSTVLLNHDVKVPIGRVTKAEFDKHGLLIDVLISKTEPDIIQKIKEGVLNKFSIRGEVLEREKKFMPEFDRVVNVIKRMSLIEVSLVSVPANPEAKAIGWYLSKALHKSEKVQTGGQPMADKETKKSGDPGTVTDAPAKTDETNPEGKEDSGPAPESKEPEAPNPEDGGPEDSQRGGEKSPESEDTPAAEASTPETISKKQDPPRPAEAKSNLSKAHLTLIWSLLDRLADVGGEAAPLAIQTKTLLKWMMGAGHSSDVSIPPVLPLVPIPSKSTGPSEQEIAKKISDEVKKQLDAALKIFPTQRKGLTQPAPEADEIKKTFEGLPPEKKLKVALALQQG